METDPKVKGYSRLLIPIPPNPKIKEKVEELMKGRQEIIETEIFEGLIFEWRSWYFGKRNNTQPRWKSELERIYEKEGEEMLAIDWIGEDDWEYIDLSDNEQYAEVFSNRYENKEACVTVYPTFLRITNSNNFSEVGYDQLKKVYIKELVKGDALPIFKKLWRRGILHTQK